MKKAIGIILLLCVIAGVSLLYLTRRPATAFTEKERYFLIPSDSADEARVIRQLREQGILSDTRIFEWMSRREGYATKVKPGRYRIEKGMSERDVYRMLMLGRQEPVRFVINKFRTKEDFSRFAGRQLECDSADVIKFLRSPDSLSTLGLDTSDAMTSVIPNTYSIYWNTTAGGLLRRLHQERTRFWTAERKEKAKQAGLTETQVYVLASIIEEETNKHDEKPDMASVYINRFRKGMPLGADPTVKFALRDFSIKRILFSHIEASAASPYNTYKNRGIPPGPICTPSVKSIDAVLNASTTEYLFFCARSDFSGYHAFAKNEQEHLRNARAYQHALDSLLKK
jgi:UPF0755 protein